MALLEVLTVANLASQVPNAFGPNSWACLPEVVAELAKVSGVSIEMAGNPDGEMFGEFVVDGFFIIEGRKVPYGNFGRKETGWFNYGKSGLFIHVKNPTLFSLVHELGHMVQIVTEKRDLGEYTEIPASIAERVCMEVLYPERAAELFELDRVLGDRHRECSELVASGMSETEARAVTGHQSAILPLFRMDYADNGRKGRYNQWGDWPTGTPITFDWVNE